MKKYEIEKITSNGIRIPNCVPIWIIEFCFTFVVRNQNDSCFISKMNLIEDLGKCIENSISQYIFSI